MTKPIETRMNRFPYKIGFIDENETGPEPGWLRFRFLRGSLPIAEIRHRPNCKSYILPHNRRSLSSAGVHFDVQHSTLKSMSSALLRRRVFVSPEFIEIQPSVFTPLDEVSNLIHDSAILYKLNNHRYMPYESYLFESIMRIIILYWQNSESAEIELDPEFRPPSAFRQALAFIRFKKGIIDSTKQVSVEAGTGLRTLESLFAQWMNIGIARYAKMLRLMYILNDVDKLNGNISVLSHQYGFSNLYRLKKDLSNLDASNLNELDSEKFYRRLQRERKTQLAAPHAKRNANA